MTNGGRSRVPTLILYHGERGSEKVQGLLIQISAPRTCLEDTKRYYGERSSEEVQGLPAQTSAPCFRLEDIKSGLPHLVTNGESRDLTLGLSFQQILKASVRAAELKFNVSLILLRFPWNY